MRLPHFNPLWIWAARDLMRHPYETILLALALTLLVTIAGTTLLLLRALSTTAIDLLMEGPSLVVRRIDGGEWTPLPVRESLQAAIGVPGVIDARARLWGTAVGHDGPLTIVGIREEAGKDLLAAMISSAPKPGEALVGYGIPSGQPHGSLTLIGAKRMNLTIIGRLPPTSSMAAHDLVLLHEADARALLGVPAGFASDLAVDVYHEEEEQAIIPELAAAFPWPVRITTRAETVGTYSAGWARRGGIVLMTLLPALLAFAFLVAGTVRDRIGRSYEVGLLKALGWTVADVVKLQMFRSVLIASFAMALGMVTAHLLVFWPGVQWIGSFLLGWKGEPPSLYLKPSGAILVYLGIFALLILPFLLATLWPALKGAAADPQELISREGG